MLAQEFKNMNETLKMIYELDDLAFSVLGESSCEKLDLTFFKLLKDRAAIVIEKESIHFNTTNDIRIELGSTPQFIAYNNKMLLNAQATNSTSTDDKAQSLYMMGEQMGMATKLYQIKGADAPDGETNDDWYTTLAIGGVVCLLFVIIVASCINKRQNKAKLTADDLEGDVAYPLSLND